MSVAAPWFPDEWFPNEWFGGPDFETLFLAMYGEGTGPDEGPGSAPARRKRSEDDEEEGIRLEDFEGWIAAQKAHRARVYAQPAITVPPLLPVVVEEIPLPPIAAQPIVLRPRQAPAFAGLKRNEGLPEGEEAELLITAMMFMEEMAA